MKNVFAYLPVHESRYLECQQTICVDKNINEDLYLHFNISTLKHARGDPFKAEENRNY